jgi:phosphoglycolate phosphatase-like HAD superfamily hydrolase
MAGLSDTTVEQWKAHHDGNVFEKPTVAFHWESREIFRQLYFEEVCLCIPFFSQEELRRLSEEFTLFIISSNREYSIEKYLCHHELEYFKEILGGEFHKSKVEKFKYVFQKYNFSAEESYFITDTLWDILEWNEVWIETIAVDFGFHERERLEQWKPFKIISSTKELNNILKI